MLHTRHNMLANVLKQIDLEDQNCHKIPRKRLDHRDPEQFQYSWRDPQCMLSIFVQMMREYHLLRPMVPTFINIHMWNAATWSRRADRCWSRRIMHERLLTIWSKSWSPWVRLRLCHTASPFEIDSNLTIRREKRKTSYLAVRSCVSLNRAEKQAE